jgi:hypothetical protein
VEDGPITTAEEALRALNAAEEHLRAAIKSFASRTMKEHAKRALELFKHLRRACESNAEVQRAVFSRSAQETLANLKHLRARKRQSRGPSRS